MCSRVIRNSQAQLVCFGISYLMSHNLFARALFCLTQKVRQLQISTICIYYMQHYVCVCLFVPKSLLSALCFERNEICKPLTALRCKRNVNREENSNAYVCVQVCICVYLQSAWNVKYIANFRLSLTALLTDEGKAGQVLSKIWENVCAGGAKLKGSLT